MRESGGRRSVKRGRRGRTRTGVAALGLAVLGGAALVAAESARVTPPSGPSLVSRIETGVDWGSFGRAGSDGSTTAVATAGELWLVDGFEVTGDDLYRINCRSCHGAEAKGSRSGVPPLHGALVERSASAAPGKLGPELEVRHRLLVGGRVMPPFSHLEGDEVALVVGWLEALRDGRPAPATKLRQSAARIGEHLVKANCQICHDAVPGVARQPLDRQVPALAEMTTRDSVREFVRKTREGSPRAGDPKGRMPRFDYLSETELEAAYVYLTAFPPRAE
jgi:mono/diheme cytochrome c family protein